jgi:hypothetical protein
MLSGTFLETRLSIGWSLTPGTCRSTNNPIFHAALNVDFYFQQYNENIYEENSEFIFQSCNVVLLLYDLNKY